MDWLPRQILVDAGKATADNPTAIVDRKSGAVHFLYQVNYARCFYMRSDDDGQTFTPAVDITSVFDGFGPSTTGTLSLRGQGTASNWKTADCWCLFGFRPVAAVTGHRACP